MPLTLELSRQIDRLCDQFEAEWTEKSGFDLHPFLTQIDKCAHSDLINELVGVTLALTAGEIEAVEMRLVSANPALSEQIRTAITEAEKSKPDNETPQRAPIRCPECQELIHLTLVDSAELITCENCQGEFRLICDGFLGHPSDELISLGKYRLVERIGAGQFGTVWKAQDTELNRFVALKMLHSPMDESAHESFIREAQFAARLDHPGIVPVHECTRHDSLSLIVSDYVAGETLREWMAAHAASGISAREATGLCIQIADALQHAHDNDVVHRDLKPSNILLDARRGPRLADFGLSKLESDASVLVNGDLVGTPAYMSPEQAQGHNTDRRSDIYSLGVVLFELLTGTRPFGGRGVMLQNKIIDEEPPSPRSLNARIPKDLDTITLKCLRKDPKRRYLSARELAEDLERWQNDQPIRARPIGRLQRAVKWMRRHKAISTLLLTLFSLSIVTVFLAIRAEANARTAQQRERLANEARRTETLVREVLVAAFTSASPTHNGQSITVAEILDFAERIVRERLADQPHARATLLAAIGRTRNKLGLTDKAILNLVEAFGLRSRLLGRGHQDTLRTQFELADAYTSAGEMVEAIRLHEEVLRLRRKVLGDTHEETIDSMTVLAAANAAAGQVDDAIKLHTNARKLAEQHLGRRHPVTLAIHNNLAVSYRLNGQADSALKLYEETLPLTIEVHGEAHANSTSLMWNVGSSYATNRDYDRAIPLLTRCAELQAKLYGRQHSLTLRTLDALLRSHFRLQQHAKSRELIEAYQLLSVLRLRKSRDRHLQLLRTCTMTYYWLKDYERARDFGEMSLSSHRSVLGKEERLTLNASNLLAIINIKSGQTMEGIGLLRQTSKQMDEALGMDDPDSLAIAGNLGRNLFLVAGRPNEAIPYLERVFAGRSKILGAKNQDTINSMERLAHAYLEAGRYKLGLPHLELQVRTLEESAPRTTSLAHKMMNLAYFYHQLEMPKKAREMGQRAAEIYALAAQAEPGRAVYHNWLASAHLAAGATEAHTRICVAMMDRFADVRTAHRAVAYTLVATPAAAQHADRVIALAEGGAGPGRDQRLLGAALYRGGRWEEALAKFEVSRKARPELRPWDFAFRSMIYLRLGKKYQARQSLRRAKEIPLDTLPWNERVETVALMREAAQLLANAD